MAEFRHESTARGVEMARVLQELQGTIHFVIDRLGKSQVPENAVSETCRLMMPAWFVQEHGDKLQEVIVLRSTSSSIPCRVRLRIYNTSTSKAPAIKFGKGWRDFATCNGLVMGDSLIFELRGLSQFEVYVFRGTGLPIDISSSQVSQAPKEVSTDSEMSQKNGFQYNLNASCNRLNHHLVGERSEGSEDDDDHCEAVIKKRKPVEDAASASRCTDPSIKLRLSELENIQVSSTKTPNGSQNSQQPSRFVHQLLSVPSIRNRHHGSQASQDILQGDHQGLRMPFNLNVSAQRNCSFGSGDVKIEFHQPAEVILPSFIHKLLEHNVQDSAGNTSGARFNVPLTFVKTHSIRLNAHVKLQGTREGSPSRIVTCSYDILQDGDSCSTRVPLSLGWGDFVRDNALQAGQELVFTLASDSFFVIREQSMFIQFCGRQCPRKLSVIIENLPLMAEYPRSVAPNAKEVAMVLKVDNMAKVLVTLNGQHSAHFVVMALSPSQVPEATGSSNCRLMLPSWFTQEHGGKLKLQDFVILQSASSPVSCRVRLRVRNRTPKISEFYFGKGWKAFARSNGLMVGDSLIFELRAGMSEFQVHIFRGNGKPTAISSSHAPTTKCSADSQLSHKNIDGQYDSNGGCSAHDQHLSAEGSHCSLGLPDEQSEVVLVKKLKVGEEGAMLASQCNPENSSLIQLSLSELVNVQVSSLQMRHDLLNGQEPPVHHLGIKITPSFTGLDNPDARNVHVKEEFQNEPRVSLPSPQPSAVPLPSFIQRLVVFNVQDTAGNTSGARFDVPLSFVRKHGVQLQTHVRLQGTREDSPFRTVTCTYNMLQDSEERSQRPPLSLGWGDFVRDNALQADQELVFTLASDSVFLIREVSEIVVYTK